MIKQLLGFSVLALLQSQAYASLILSIEDAAVQSSQVNSELRVEDFNRISTSQLDGYRTSFGQYFIDSGKPSIQAAGPWGGAQGIGNYLFVPRSKQSAVSLNFFDPVSYFGFWWSAGDGGNLLRVNTATETLEFTTQAILDSSALVADHFGNPNRTNSNTKEPYAFVNLFASTSQDYIESITFYGSNFETDNHSIAYESVALRGRSLAATNVPEPLSAGLFALACLGLAYKRSHKKQGK
ncbi:hypothetical protein DBZ36_10365 [Alginatibacterium sediminis]|uniref:PEP-CTERM sorting domain-containing protein n=1 Tax=Alginatibacterium sediminis TaxID=2164068 RepID=A0A420EDH6_9ALTE|nr:hypothetical protein [Alginatibacterium sediminis]RKF18789.1 hypothetical protein DBZ36_10365 [Alginatibacterium sediminis]